MNVHVDVAEGASLTLVNATLVLPDGLVRKGAVRARGGRIEAVEPEASGGDAIDCRGDVVMPGIVDVHTDHFEKHVFPRSHVRWDALRAALAHDAQIIGSGTTTVFDSITVGTVAGDADRHTILAPMLDALQTGREAGMLRAEHLIHLRCETADARTPERLRDNVQRPLVRIVSLMDHTPGRRQSRDLAGYIARRMAETGLGREAVEAELRAAWARVEGVVERVRAEVLAAVAPLGLIVMSHDDVTKAHIDEARADGVTIAEFPTTLEAAHAARAAEMPVVAGAPNYLRGGSQAGNVAVAELLGEGLVDILASDYVPRSILDAVFAIAADPRLPLDLSAAAAMATLAPARAAGLADRGAIAPGLRADLLRVGVAAGQPFVRAAWREGVRVA